MTTDALTSTVARWNQLFWIFTDTVDRHHAAHGKPPGWIYVSQQWVDEMVAITGAYPSVLMGTMTVVNPRLQGVSVCSVAGRG
jgi:hypothetical protein